MIIGAHAKEHLDTGRGHSAQMERRRGVRETDRWERPDER